jgi:hypothetical protein
MSRKRGLLSECYPAYWVLAYVLLIAVGAVWAVVS